MTSNETRLLVQIGRALALTGPENLVALVTAVNLVEIDLHNQEMPQPPFNQRVKKGLG